MIIYVDILFLINFLSCYLLIDIMCHFKQRKISNLKKLFSSVIGAIGAIVIFIFNFEHYIVSSIYAVTSALIVVICFGKMRFFKNIMIFFMIYMLLGASLIFVFCLANKNADLFIKNNIIYFDIKVEIFALCLICTYPLVSLFFYIIRQHSKKKFHTLTLINKGQTICVRALFDSGNMLKEPISGKDVIIMNENEAKKLTTQNQKFVKIPFSTISGKDTLDAFVIDIMIIDKKYILQNQYVGIIEGKLSNADEYSALIGNLEDLK